MSENAQKSDFCLDNFKFKKILGFSKNKGLKLKSASKKSTFQAFSGMGCLELSKIQCNTCKYVNCPAGPADERNTNETKKDF